MTRDIGGTLAGHSGQKPCPAPGRTGQPPYKGAVLVPGREPFPAEGLAVGMTYRQEIARSRESFT